MAAITPDCFLNSTVFQYDGDVAGIGVRLSFYIQNFLLGMSLEINGPGMVISSRGSFACR
jgi:hypothetical protein